MQPILYIVATPIGNLLDITYRAVEVLRTVSVIAAEDTRHSRRLLDHYGMATPLLALHDHNESDAASAVLRRLHQGETVALISDAGTPLINDPGFRLVRAAREAGIRVVPVPGPCALIAALSVAGLPTDRFTFEGFPPRTTAARRAFFQQRLEVTGTLVFYESSHRIIVTVQDLQSVFPAARRLVIARELTKIHETILYTTVAEALEPFNTDPYMHKGEFVVVVQGADEPRETSLTAEQQRALALLLAHCSVKTAVAVAAELTGAPRNVLYAEALRLQQQD